jgi:protein-disulfide isomerase
MGGSFRILERSGGDGLLPPSLSRKNAMSKRPILTLLAAVAGLALLLAGCSGQSDAASGGGSGDQIALQQVNANYPVTVDQAAATVLAGQPSAPTTVDAYEDFLCPFCGQYERGNAANLEKALEAGQIKIRYHILNLLDTHSEPAGYSSLSANAALLVAQNSPKAFPAFHASLYANQPQEGDAGYTADQLTDLAKRAGVTDPNFAKQLAAAPFTKQISKNLADATNDPQLQQDVGNGQKGFGTPTVLVNGKLANLADSNWLTSTR